MNITSNDIRNKYLEFFKSKNHAIIPSASVVPENDPTVLFNTAGMQPLLPYLRGEKHPLGKRLVDYQEHKRKSEQYYLVKASVRRQIDRLGFC